MEDKIECFIANLEGYVFIIPSAERDLFEGTSYYDRKDIFSQYVLPDDVILEEILVDGYDLRCLIDGDLD